MTTTFPQPVDTSSEQYKLLMLSKQIAEHEIHVREMRKLRDRLMKEAAENGTPLNVIAQSAGVSSTAVGFTLGRYERQRAGAKRSHRRATQFI